MIRRTENNLLDHDDGRQQRMVTKGRGRNGREQVRGLILQAGHVGQQEQASTMLLAVDDENDKLRR